MRLCRNFKIQKGSFIKQKQLGSTRNLPPYSLHFCWADNPQEYVAAQLYYWPLLHSTLGQGNSVGAPYSTPGKTERYLNKVDFLSGFLFVLFVETGFSLCSPSWSGTLSNLPAWESRYEPPWMFTAYLIFHASFWFMYLQISDLPHKQTQNYEKQNLQLRMIKCKNALNQNKFRLKY